MQTLSTEGPIQEWTSSCVSCASQACILDSSSVTPTPQAHPATNAPLSVDPRTWKNVRICYRFVWTLSPTLVVPHCLWPKRSYLLRRTCPMEIFPTLQASFARLVRNVRSGLTARLDETQSEMLAVVRLSVRRGLRARIDAHMQLVAALLP